MQGSARTRDNGLPKASASVGDGGRVARMQGKWVDDEVVVNEGCGRSSIGGGSSSLIPPAERKRRRAAGQVCEASPTEGSEAVSR